MMASIIGAPSWLLAMRRHGVPRFASFRQYAPNAGLAEMAEFVSRQTPGAFDWDEVALFRDHWKGPLLVKGILHPRDAERALAIGCDGIVVYAAQLKKPVTIRLDEGSISYFKGMAEETGIPYQSLINLYLKECAATGKRLSLAWKSVAAKNAA